LIFFKPGKLNDIPNKVKKIGLIFKENDLCRISKTGSETLADVFKYLEKLEKT
jgi:hypothetical protein